MATPSRDLTVIYGSVTIGTGTEDDYQLLNGWTVTGSRLSGFVSFDVVVFGTDEDDLDTKCETLKEEFRKRRTRLQLKIGSSTHKDFNNTGNIHQDSQAQFQEIDDEWWTRLSRHYRLIVAVDYPPPESNGRTEQSVVLSHDDSQIKSLTISAQYNATSSGTAKNRYEADFDGYCTSVLNVFGTGLTFEKRGPDQITGDFLLNNELQITRVYREIIVGQASTSLTDDSDFVGFQYNVILGKQRPGDFIGSGLPAFGDTGEVKRLINIQVTCSTNVDKTSSTDLTGLYTDKIRPFLLEKAKTISGCQTIALIEEDPQFNETNNLISVSMRISGAIEGINQVIAFSVQTIIQDDYGRLIIGAWDGNPYSYYVIQGKAKKNRVVTETKQEVGGGRDLYGVVGRGSMPDKGKDSGWITLFKDTSESPTVIGFAENGDAESMPITQTTVRTAQQYIEKPQKSRSVITTG